MSQNLFWAAAFFTVFSVRVTAQIVSDPSSTPKPDLWAFESLKIPAIQEVKGSQPVLVAIVDDGFNLEHKAINSHIFRNEKESLTNNDDDGNSFNDDIVGWDIGDADNDVAIPKGREQFFYHGTMVAGVVAQVAQRAFGNKASDMVKILPVKALKDDDQKHDYTLGYDGIQYAINMGADIVVCAWGGGKYNAERHDQIFREAEDKGVMIIAAAGNFYSERCDPPASISTVYAIAAFDSSFKKTTESNYGLQIDLSAAGEFVYAPHPAGNTTYGYLDGTSSASALVGGCAAVLKAMKPRSKKEELMMALKNTAVPIDRLNMTYAGKLGAGYPDLGKAVNYMNDEGERATYFNSKKSEGSIVIGKQTDTKSWKIEPDGSFTGYNFSLSGPWPKGNDPIEFFAEDQLLSSALPQEFPPNYYVKTTSVEVRYNGKRPKNELEILYSSIPMDSTVLYCSGTKVRSAQTGEFEDGSGELNYANESDCKWQISVRPGYRVWLEFDRFKTEPKKDVVYIFNGNGTQQENLIAKFTGTDQPPIIVSNTNEVLVWFVTNGSKTAKGWHLNYSATKEDSGIKGVRNQ